MYVLYHICDIFGHAIRIKSCATCAGEGWH